jgi:hypothetical protein
MFQTNLIHWSWILEYDSYRLPDLEVGLTAVVTKKQSTDVTGRHCMLTPCRHLFLPLVYPEICVCLILWFIFPTGLNEIDYPSLLMAFLIPLWVCVCQAIWFVYPGGIMRLLIDSYSNCFIIKMLFKWIRNLNLLWILYNFTDRA